MEKLKEYFDFFEYEKEDADFFLSVYSKIQSDKESSDLWRSAIELYEREEKCDYTKIISIADEVAEKLYLNTYTTEWLIYFCFLPKLRERYKEKGLSDELYRHTMLNLRYNLEEGKIIKGVKGYFAASWFNGFFDMTRFALGRLQFEIILFGDYYKKEDRGIPLDKKVINVHIPRSGLPLSPESVDEAFMLAREFYKKEVGEDPIFVCFSWLLYPDNEKILPPHTNIYKFMKRFEIIYSAHNKNGENLWRLFDTDEKNPDRLPANSSVRRAYIEHLKKGGKTGAGLGIIISK